MLPARVRSPETVLRLVSMAALGLVCAAVATPAAAGGASAGKVSPGSRYLALGDSVTFGYQEAQIQPPPNYTKASTLPGYPEHLGSALHLRVTNAACPGETSSSLVNATGPSNGCENSPPPNQNEGYRRS